MTTNAPDIPMAEGLMLDGVALADIAGRFGTPCYVYSQKQLQARCEAYQQALAAHPPGGMVCYSVKANGNLALLRLIAQWGLGCDVVSGGELARAQRAGVPASRIVFSGVGKSRVEIAAALRAGIHCFNVESAAELIRIETLAREWAEAGEAATGEYGHIVTADRRAPVSLRINPDVDAATHPYISTGLRNNKFGIAHHAARALYQYAARSRYLRVIGIDCHIGSQITTLTPFADALARMMALVDQLETDGIVLEHIDLGGGLGIRYREEDSPPAVEEHISTLLRALAGRSLQVILEPGRSLVGEAGLLLTRVEYLKDNGEAGEATRHFAIVDAAMNDLLRPALYAAWMPIESVQARAGVARNYAIVGPVCESADFLGHDRPLVLAEDDLLAIRCAGAYGMSMSSQYNARPRAAEVLIANSQPHLIRRRETLEDLWAAEEDALRYCSGPVKF